MTIPYPTSFRIQGSVGSGGRNDRQDVIIVQTLLKEAARDPGEKTIDPGTIDGDCGSHTIRAIRTFQDRFMHSPDGRVDPDGQTLANLLHVTFHDGGMCVPRQPTALELLKLLLPHDGDKYVFGAAVPKENSNWIGPWDCAEFVAWGIYQVTGRYVGCRQGRAPNGVLYQNAYTGYFAKDLPGVATQITEDEAADLPGAIALRAPGGHVGHIAVSRGGNRTIEAASTREGVRSKQLKGRSWNSYWKLNNLRYDWNICPFP